MSNIAAPGDVVIDRGHEMGQNFGYSNPVIAQQQTVVVGQTAPLPRTPYPQNLRPWTADLYGCCHDCRLCMETTCCFSCMTCEVSQALGEGTCTGFCYGMLPLRVKLRSILGITGNVDDDAWVTCCCPYCAVAQIKQELQNLGMLPGRNAPAS